MTKIVSESKRFLEIKPPRPSSIPIWRLGNPSPKPIYIISTKFEKRQESEASILLLSLRNAPPKKGLKTQEAADDNFIVTTATAEIPIEKHESIKTLLNQEGEKHVYQNERKQRFYLGGINDRRGDHRHPGCGSGPLLSKVYSEIPPDKSGYARSTRITD
jgi:hypothetical protein